LGYQARDTIGNAQETALWARKNKLETVKVVTSDYHMARSLLELSEALPETHLVPCAVKAGYGFKNPKLFREYNKLVYSFFLVAARSLWGSAVQW